MSTPRRELAYVVDAVLEARMVGVSEEDCLKVSKAVIIWFHTWVEGRLEDEEFDHRVAKGLTCRKCSAYPEEDCSDGEVVMPDKVHKQRREDARQIVDLFTKMLDMPTKKGEDDRDRRR